MKTPLVALVLLMGPGPPIGHSEHLEPDVGVFVHPDGYLLKVRHVFAQAFDEGVRLRALVLPSFRNEFAVGLKHTDNRVEAFLLEPSSSIWDTELVAMYKAGEIRTFELGGKETPPEEDEEVKALLKRTPADYRDIKPIRQARPVPKDLADRIRALWETMLLDVRHPRNAGAGADGVTYHFSTWIQGRGDLSGHVWSPDSKSRAGRLTRLAKELASFARGDTDLDALMKRVEKAERTIQP